MAKKKMPLGALLAFFKNYLPTGFGDARQLAI